MTVFFANLDIFQLCKLFLQSHLNFQIRIPNTRFRWNFWLTGVQCSHRTKREGRGESDRYLLSESGCFQGGLRISLSSGEKGDFYTLPIVFLVKSMTLLNILSMSFSRRHCFRKRVHTLRKKLSRTVRMRSNSIRHMPRPISEEPDTMRKPRTTRKVSLVRLTKEMFLIMIILIWDVFCAVHLDEKLEQQGAQVMMALVCVYFSLHFLEASLSRKCEIFILNFQMEEIEKSRRKEWTESHKNKQGQRMPIRHEKVFF